MTLFLIILLVGGMGFLTYRSLVKTQKLEEASNDQPETTVAPVLTQACGCGRSKTGYCVGLHKLSEEEWAVHEDNPNKKKPKRSRKSKDASTLSE